MAKQSLQSALARKAEPDSQRRAGLRSPPKAPDTRMVTSLRLAPELLAALKVLAVRERSRVNDVIIEAIRDHLALKGQPVAEGSRLMASPGEPTDGRAQGVARRVGGAPRPARLPFPQHRPGARGDGPAR